MRGQALFKLSVPCTECDTLVTVITESTDLMFIKCKGCGRYIVTVGNILVSSKPDRVEKLLEIVGKRTIGRVLDTDITMRYSTRPDITDEDVSGIGDTLRDIY